jgi:hypothetical protein
MRASDHILSGTNEDRLWGDVSDAELARNDKFSRFRRAALKKRALADPFGKVSLAICFVHSALEKSRFCHDNGVCVWRPSSVPQPRR